MVLIEMCGVMCEEKCGSCDVVGREGRADEAMFKKDGTDE